MNENNIKVLFPEGIETITISKNDYDRLFGQLSYENIILKSKIEKAIEYIENLKNFKINYVMLEEKELYASEKDFVKDLLDILKENE